MGWNVSHGSDQYGQERRSYTTITNLAAHLKTTLPPRDWRKIANIFDHHSGKPFDVPPRKAAICAELLDRAANSGRMQPGWAHDARLFAAAARHASNANEPWNWS